MTGNPNCPKCTSEGCPEPFCEMAGQSPTDLRKRSDDLLLACGWSFGYATEIVIRPNGNHTKQHVWTNPRGEVCETPHPYANTQDAIDLAEAMGLEVASVYRNSPSKYTARLVNGVFCENCPTIAEAITAAILEAVKKRTEE